MKTSIFDKVPRWAQWVGAATALLTALLGVARLGLSVYTSWQAIGRATAADSSQNYSIAQLIIMHADDQKRVHNLEKVLCPRVTATERRLLELECR